MSKSIEFEAEDFHLFDSQNLTNYQFDPLESFNSFSEYFQTPENFSSFKFQELKQRQINNQSQLLNKAQSEPKQGSHQKIQQQQLKLLQQNHLKIDIKLGVSEKQETTSVSGANHSSPSNRKIISCAKRSLKKKQNCKNKPKLCKQFCKIAEQLFREKKSLIKVRESLCISQRAALKLRKQFVQTGRIANEQELQKCQKEASLKEKQKAQAQQALKRLITKNCSITLKQMQKALKQQGIHRSKSSIHGYLQKMKYSRKKLQKVPLQRNSNNNIVYRQNYCKMIQQIPLQKQVFVDQTIFGLQTSGHYGWAPRGQQPKVLIPASRKKHITLLAAISIKGFQATQIIKGPVTSKHICEFLQHYLDHLQPDEVVILDNARMHHAAIVKSKIKQLNRNIRYIPAYTPQLNPIQNVFSEIKAQYIRLKQDKDLKQQEIVKLVEQAVKTMRSKQFSKYYQHYQKWLKLGISGQLFN